MSNFEIFESRFYLQEEVSRTNRQFLYYHENKMMYIKNGGVKLCGGVPAFLYSVHPRCRLLHVKFLENWERPRSFQCKAPNVQFYKCVEHEKLKCPATGRLENQKFSIKPNQTHNHTDHGEDIKKYQIIHKMKEGVASSNAPPLEVYNNELPRFSDDMMSSMNYDQVSSTLRGIRQRSHPRCSNDLDLYELLTENADFSEKYGKLRDQNWFQTMLVEGTESCILFLTEQIIVPRECTLFFDGTFKARPTFYAGPKGQIFNMFVEANGKPHLFAFALMTCRTEALYIKLFNFLRDERGVQAGQLMSDFEIGLRNAAKKTWGNQLRVLGCLFHFRKAIRENFHKLVGNCSDEVVHSTLVQVKRMFNNLPLLPLDKIPAGFKAIKAYQAVVYDREPFELFNRYFERFWMTTITPNEFCVGDSAYRTNNHVESFHRTMNARIKIKPPIDFFLAEMQKLCLYHLNNYLSHFIAPRFSPITENLKKSLERLLENRSTLEEFLILDYNEHISEA